MTIDADLYFNLHKRVWSLRARATGRVAAHARAVAFLQGARFVVRPAGRQAVLRTGQKTVHAFIRGQASVLDAFPAHALEGMVAVSYNPYKAGHFVRTDTGAPIHASSRVFMIANAGQKPQVWAIPS